MNVKLSIDNCGPFTRGRRLGVRAGVVAWGAVVGALDAVTSWPQALSARTAITSHPATRLALTHLRDHDHPRSRDCSLNIAMLAPSWCYVFALDLPDWRGSKIFPDLSRGNSGE